jgi:hypothetical protein
VQHLNKATWASLPLEPPSFDLEWGSRLLAGGMTPFGIARVFLSDDGVNDPGMFTADLLDWLLHQDCLLEDIGRFARSMRVNKSELVAAIGHRTREDRLSLLTSFISGEPLRTFPPKGASARQVAPYLEDLLVADPDLPEITQRQRLGRICEENGWAWSQVSRRLRQDRITRIKKIGRPRNVELTERGIAVHVDRFPAPQPICPYKHKTFSLPHLAIAVKDKKCGSPSCKKCGPKIADELLGFLERLLAPLKAVYVAQVRWTPNLQNVMSQRRSATGMNTFTYRSIDGVVTIVADQPIRGRNEPKAVEPMTPDAAIDLLTTVLEVPERDQISWSSGWEPETHEAGDGIDISLKGLTDPQVEQFRQSASQIARCDYGVDIGGDDELPPEHWPSFRTSLIKVRDNLKAGRPV